MLFGVPQTRHIANKDLDLFVNIIFTQVMDFFRTLPDVLCCLAAWRLTSRYEAWMRCQLGVKGLGSPPNPNLHFLLEAFVS